MLADELAWRRKEILGIHLIIRTTVNVADRAILRRAAVTLLYAHWEGFVKDAATRYVAFVRQQRLPANALQSNFLILSVHSKLREVARSNRASELGPIVEALTAPARGTLNFPYRGVINTESNLNGEVLRDILYCCGIDFGLYWTSKELLLNGSLLKTRNEIAHGGRVDVDQPTYDQLHSFLIEALDAFRTDLENAAVSEGFKRSVGALSGSAETST